MVNVIRPQLPSWLLAILLGFGLFISSALLSISHSSDIVLPDLGDGSSALISPQQEYELGQKWLRFYRSQVFTSNDPFIQSYLERLIRKLSFSSELKDKRLDVLLIDNPTLNAFAVPGGIIGVHTGLLKFAQNEHQLASVLSHELAHISQRHYARRLIDQKESSIPNLAALLASILIAATAGGEAGLAAITATNAASVDSQLRFSRQLEQEADRVGMETLVRANMDPFEMPAMFQQMQRSLRYTRRPPEFLLTHPLPQSRIADSQLRAQQYQRRHFERDPEYQLIRVRALLTVESKQQASAKRFRQELQAGAFSEEAARYGIALASINANDFETALDELEILLNTHPENMYFLAAKADALLGMEKEEDALAILTALYEHDAGTHPVNIRLAETLMKTSRYKECEALLVEYSKLRPKDEYVWYLLAEIHGLTGNILEVHIARAEYFLLNGLFEKSEIQLRNALKLSKEDKFLTARLEQKLIRVKQLKREFTG